MSSQPPFDLFTGKGEMPQLMRAHDWSNTSLGDAASWAQSLKAALGICIGSRFPIAIYWGRELALLYNDAWSPIPGTKHPWALGRPAREVWPEIWEAIGPLFEQVQTTGEATYVEDALLLMHRHGYTEECYFNYTFTPIRGETGDVQGVFNAVIETTYRVIGERRARLLRDLGERIAAVRSAEDACRTAVESLASDGTDVPFCLVYRAETDATARLLASGGLPERDAAAPAEISLTHASQDVWPLASLLNAAHVEPVSDLGSRFRDSLPGGRWPEAARTAMIAPIRTGLSDRLFGFLVLGASPRRAVDDEYLQFASHAASQIAAAVANATAYQLERDRAESLAALDRAKTAFFSNVSHEFRTPLTLMLGPLEDILAKPETDRRRAQREALTVVHRNSLRLLKMVNALLDFSRIEAGRMQAVYAPTDISQVTAELAGVFRTAIEKAGMQLIVDCPAIDAPVLVDRDLWEKIVLNLLSNAFKFTFDGEIEVRLRLVADAVELTVRDTGVGIAEKELPHVFERFHRVEGARRRSYEGTGIGLALVHELSKLHGGSVSVASIEGQGSAFTVVVPTGSAHLPQDQVRASPTSASSSIGAATYADEAVRWLPVSESMPVLAVDSSTDGDPITVPDTERAAGRPRVVVADDNTDVRDYVRRLLSQRFDVEAVANGRDALVAARTRRPDLVLTDVMMPELDGFALLSAIRADPTLRDVPVIMLSARAGEHASVEGVEAGADDYLVKPFSARELLARVSTHLELARVRRATADRITMILESSTDAIMLFDDKGRFTYLNGVAKRRFTDQRLDPESLIGQRLFQDVFVDAADSEAARALHRATSEREAAESEVYYEPWHRWFADRFYPTPDGGTACFSQDVTDRKRAADALAVSEERFRLTTDAMPQLVWTASSEGVVDYYSARAAYYSGLTPGARTSDWRPMVHPDDLDVTLEAWRQAVQASQPYSCEHRLRMVDGEYRWHLSRAEPVTASDAESATIRWIGTATDIHELRITQEALRRNEARLHEADRRKDEFLAILAHELRNPLAPIRTGLELIRLGGDKPGAVERIRPMMERQVGHMVRLIDDLLDVSRITSGKIQLQRESTTLSELVHSAVEANRPAIDAAGIQLTVELPATPCHLYVDRTRFVQVLSNLLHNAAKFTESGGSIAVSGEETEDEWKRPVLGLTVRDTGVGMSPELLPRVFDLFVQGEGPGHGKPGLGIGLALARRLIEMHEGRIEAVSDGAGRGSAFVIHMPVVSSLTQPDAAATPHESLTQIRRRVLIIDDNCDAADTLAELVRTLGGVALTANDGLGGARRASEFVPDVVLLDIGMPGIDGYETCRLIRKACHYDVFIVALTGWGQEQDKDRAVRAGFDAHMTKPADPSVLARLLAAPTAPRVPLRSPDPLGYSGQRG